MARNFLNVLMGVTPRADHLCTAAGRQAPMLATANARAQAWVKRTR
jgi:hypothetical protein